MKKIQPSSTNSKRPTGRARTYSRRGARISGGTNEAQRTDRGVGGGVGEGARSHQRSGQGLRESLLQVQICGSSLSLGGLPQAAFREWAGGDSVSAASEWAGRVRNGAGALVRTVHV